MHIKYTYNTYIYIHIYIYIYIFKVKIFCSDTHLNFFDILQVC